MGEQRIALKVPLHARAGAGDQVGQAEHGVGVIVAELDLGLAGCGQ
jgi:hypothetical protein